MRVSHLLALGVLAGATAQLSACSLLQRDPPPERNAAVRLDRGLQALDQGRFRAAFDELVWVYTHCPGRTASTRALVGLAALELDPRNRHGRPDVGSELLGRVITEPATPGWVRPLAETGYLMALALGAPAAGAPADTAVADSAARDTAGVGVAASRSLGRDAETGQRSASEVLGPRAEEPVHGCGAAVPATEGMVARALPTLPGPSLVTILRRTERERDVLAVRADTLQKELASTAKQLEETKAELERIRKIIKP